MIFPFYVETDSSTRKTKTGVGCRAKNGYLDTTIYQRNNGEIESPYVVRQHTTTDEDTGKTRCHTTVYFKGVVVHSYSTDY